MIRPQIIEREGKPEYAVIPIAEWRRMRRCSRSFRTSAISKPLWPSPIGA